MIQINVIYESIPDSDTELGSAVREYDLSPDPSKVEAAHLIKF